jgi:hypothetical protein
MKARDSILKNRREFVTRPPVAQGGKRPVNEKDQPERGGEGCESVPGESADRQAEEKQAR